MRRLALLIGVALRLRMRALFGGGASSILVVIGGLFYLASTVFMGGLLYLALSAASVLEPDRAAGFGALAFTLVGVFSFTRPLILTNLAGASLQTVRHLPIRRVELLAYSMLTGIAVPLLLESPALLGAALGAARTASSLLLTLPLALLAHLTLLTGAHAMSLAAVLMSRRAWLADAARALAFFTLVLPSLLTSAAVRRVLLPLVEPLGVLSPLGWAARATLHAGASDLRGAVVYGALGAAFLAALAALSHTLLGRILDGEDGSRLDRRAASAQRARLWLPGRLGALVETQLRAQLRAPAARMALLMPTLMMGLFALSLSRSGSVASPAAMVVFLSLAGGNAFLVMGRGAALVLGTPVPRSFLLVASDAVNALFRLPPLLAVIAVASFSGGREGALWMAGLAAALLPVALGMQHFVSILRPFSLPRDGLNPLAQRGDTRQAGNGLLSAGFSALSFLVSAPFLFLVWLAPRVADGSYEMALLTLAGVGAFAAYAVLVALAEGLLERREAQVVEALFDDGPQ